MRKLSSNEVNAIKGLYDMGISINTIANGFKIDESSVRYHVKPKLKLQKQGSYIKKLIAKTPNDKVVSVVGKYLNSIKDNI